MTNLSRPASVTWKAMTMHEVKLGGIYTWGKMEGNKKRQKGIETLLHHNNY